MINIDQLLKRFEHLRSYRQQNWESHWKDVADFVVPNYDNIYLTNVDGDKKGIDLYDTTGMQAAKMLSSGLHSMLTNPTLNWFGLMVGDPEIDNDESVIAYLQKCVDKMHNIFNNSNFQTEIHEQYLGLATMGTAITEMLEDEKDVIRFHSKPIYYGYIDENASGVVDTIFMSWKWELRRIIEFFGEDALPKNFMETQQTKDMDAKFEVIHFVGPRNGDEYFELDKSNNKKRKPGLNNAQFHSVYILKDKKHILKESGFYEFPFLIPRFYKLAGEKYGRSPSMDALPDIKMANAMEKTIIEAAQLSIRPPLQATHDSLYGDVELVPGAITYRRPGSQEIKPIMTGAQPMLGEQLVEQVRKRIREHFFVNQLQLSEDNPQMTATEVVQRTEEKLRMLAPQLGRFHYEILKPLIERMFGIMTRKKLLPPNPPEKLKGVDLKVKYSSMIARAQRSANVELFSRAMQIAAPLFTLKPETSDNLNADETLRFIYQDLGLPQKTLNDKNIVANTREGRAQAMKEQAEQQKAESISNVAKNTAPILA